MFCVGVVELGHFVHPCEDDLVLKCTNEKIPYFNAPLYFENKQQIGKVDEIFGPINDFVSFFYKQLSVLCINCSFSKFTLEVQFYIYCILVHYSK